LYIGIKNNISHYLSEKKECEKYRATIKKIIENREIVLDMDWGGLGDILTYTQLPRVLKETYDINFYLSENCKTISRNPDILKMCFELNPYFKGYKNPPNFKHKRFSHDKSIANILFDIKGKDIIKDLNIQFGINAPAIPEIYYVPKKITEYSNIILIDINYISGHKQGLRYDMDKIDRYAKKICTHGEKIEYIDPKKQDLCRYTDMIYSAKEFITVLSGGAALSAALGKKAIVFLPENTRGQTIYDFTFKDSGVKYIS
jgi:hypothetical protein